MHRIFAIFAILLPAIFSPVAAISQTRGIDACQFDDNPALRPAIIGQILGEWNQEYRFGYVLVSGTQIPFSGTSTNDKILFEIVDSTLVASTPEMVDPMVFLLDTERNLAAYGDGPAAFQRQFLTLVFNTEKTAGCSLSDLPQLTGIANINIQGMTMEFIWRITIISPSTIYVVQDVSGNAQGFDYFSRRTVKLFR